VEKHGEQREGTSEEQQLIFLGVHRQRVVLARSLNASHAFVLRIDCHDLSLTRKRPKLVQVYAVQAREDATGCRDPRGRGTAPEGGV
jgi:hypothetical protein